MLALLLSIVAFGGPADAGCYEAFAPVGPTVYYCKDIREGGVL
jgi:hypothetical protein